MICAAPQMDHSRAQGGRNGSDREASAGDHAETGLVDA
jgi:hypothetical protein